MTLYLDFNENPLGTSPAVVDAVIRHASELHLYPRRLHRPAAHVVAAHFGVEPAAVLLTAGVDEAIDMLLLHTGRLVRLTPGFPGYRERAQALGAPMTTMALDAEWSPPAVGSWTTGRAVTVITQPNNPTGNVYPRPWIDDLLAHAHLVCIDETFVDFSDARSFIDEIPRHANLCVFRSFSKAYGVAGVRVGALFGPPALLARLAPRQRFYSVDGIALHALQAALDDRAHHRRSVDYIRCWRGAYAATLRLHPRLFRRVADTHCNFVIAECARPTPEVVGELAAHGVRVASCGALGLAGWVRVTVGPPGALDLLRAALERADHAMGELT